MLGLLKVCPEVPLVQEMDYPAITMIMVNGLSLMAVGTLYRSWVPGWYGIIPLVLYALYIAVSLAVAFGEPATR